MSPIRLAVLAVCVACGSAAVAEDKLVRRAWFPRFSPDGATVLTANGGWDKKEGGEARLFATKDGKDVHAFVAPRGVRSVAWAMKGALIVTGGYSDGVRGFDAKDRKAVFHLAEGQSVDNVRVTPDDKLLIASFGNGDVRLYELATRKEVYLFGAAHDGGVWGMAVSPDGALLATGGKDNYANVYDLATHKRVQGLKHPGEVNGLAFTPDGKFLATGCTDARIRVFDARTGDRVGMVAGHARGAVTDLQFTSDGKQLASAGMDGTVRLWDVTDVKNPTETKQLKAHNGAGFGVAISPDDRVLVSAGWDDQVKAWDMKTGEPLWAWKRK